MEGRKEGEGKKKRWRKKRGGERGLVRNEPQITLMECPRMAGRFPGEGPPSRALHLGCLLATFGLDAGLVFHSGSCLLIQSLWESEWGRSASFPSKCEAGASFAIQKDQTSVLLRAWNGKRKGPGHWRQGERRELCKGLWSLLTEVSTQPVHHRRKQKSSARICVICMYSQRPPHQHILPWSYSGEGL